jgi:hypothetical protein
MTASHSDLAGSETGRELKKANTFRTQLIIGSWLNASRPAGIFRHSRCPIRLKKGFIREIDRAKTKAISTPLML